MVLNPLQLRPATLPDNPSLAPCSPQWHAATLIVSTPMCHLMADTFLPTSYPLVFCLCSSRSAPPRGKNVAACVAPLFLAGRAKRIFFNARASRPIPSSPDACHLANDAYNLLHLRKLARQCPSLGAPCANSYVICAKQLIQIHNAALWGVCPPAPIKGHVSIQIASERCRRHKILGSSGKNSRYDIKREQGLSSKCPP